MQTAEVNTETCSVCGHMHETFARAHERVCQLNMNMSTRKHRVQHNFEGDKNTTLLLWSSLSPQHSLDQGFVWSHQRVTVVSGHLLLTDWFCVEP